MKCNLCPRACGVDRSVSVGYCGATQNAVVAKTTLHFFEEPPISGARGSGAVFFSGCNLRCRFCQNGEISKQHKGESLSSDQLLARFLDLQEQGAHNINLVTATPHLETVIPALQAFRKQSSLPVVYNCGGYESVDALKRLEGLVDVYLPDFKYVSPILSSQFSDAPDYFEVACAAIEEMTRQSSVWVEEDGLVKRGVLIRHLVLPSHADDSIAVLREIAARFPKARVSVMSQYTPCFNDGKYKELNRRLTTYEYGKVLTVVEELGLDGFCQDRSSSTAKYTPDF